MVINSGNNGHLYVMIKAIKKYIAKRQAEKLIRDNERMYSFYMGRKSESAVDFWKGCGYYRQVPSEGSLHEGYWHELKVVFKCTAVRYFGDPEGMIDYINFCVYSIEDIKPIHECTFQEFLELYGKLENKIIKG